MALSLGMSALARWPQWSLRMRQTWWALTALLVSSIPIFLLDETLLWLEESWVRYPTAMALIAAGFAGLYLVKLRLASSMPVGETIFWLLLACCFIFLGADEYLELHESLGDWLNLMPTFAFLTQDWITSCLCRSWSVIPASVLGSPGTTHPFGPAAAPECLHHSYRDFRSLPGLRQP